MGVMESEFAAKFSAISQLTINIPAHFSAISKFDALGTQLC